MEFEEMRKIWDTQNNEPLYVIDERTMHHYILQKKRQTHHVAHISELISIISNIAGGSLVLVTTLLKSHINITFYIVAAWMFGMALYALTIRFNRQKKDQRFDRSMLGDLQHAISTATYQVRLSQIMRWNIVPVALITLLATWQGEKSTWIAIGVLIFFVVVYFASGWEHNIYRKRKQELEQLRNKLESQS